jgi:sugar O-acyltransferase (sialic acid O-acetyltransferase NeuD family)
MKDLLIIGAGNFGREVAQLIRDINQDKDQWNLLGYIDETPEKHDTVLNNTPVLGGLEWLEKNIRNRICAVCAIGNPRDKYAVIKKLEAYNIDYPNLIHPDVASNDYIEIGFGNLICYGSFLSVNIKIGNHISINPGCGIGHDTIIKDYSTLYWNVTLSSNVTINEGCEIGSKVAVIPRRTVGSWSIIGAGAVVAKDIPENCTAVGVPAKPIKFSSFIP